MSDARTIHERMIAILAEMPAIGKDRVNQQQNFKFRGIDDMVDALEPLLAKHGVFYLPKALERRDQERTTSSGKSLYVCLLHVEFTFYGLAGDHVVASAWGEGSDSGDKATSKAHTMAQKSCLMEAFNIRTQDSVDPDAETAEASTGRARQDAPATEAQLKGIWALIRKKYPESERQGALLDYCRQAGKESSRDLTFAEADAIGNKLATIADHEPEAASA